MRRWHTLGVLILIPALSMLLAAPGCSKKEEPPKGGTKTGGNQDGKPPKTNGGGQTSALTELDNKEWGTLSGTVTYDGDPPKMTPIADIEKSQDKLLCHAGADERELVDQTWLVDPKTKGVSDVAIWLKPPEGKFFKIHESYKNKKDNFVILHQPHCAFKPHVLVYWASYYDKKTKEQKPSGQKLKIVNDAKFNHNTAYSGDEDINPKGNRTLPPGKDMTVEFAAQPDSPIGFKCDIHQWMNAKCWSLDTPYCARTDKDGKFKIENVPVGVELYVVGWHQDTANDGFFYEGKGGKKMKLEKDTKLEIKVKKK